jgi:hypothetical protein
MAEGIKVTTVKSDNAMDRNIFSLLESSVVAAAWGWGNIAAPGLADPLPFSFFPLIPAARG